MQANETENSFLELYNAINVKDLQFSLCHTRMHNIFFHIFQCNRANSALNDMKDKSKH